MVARGVNQADRLTAALYGISSAISGVRRLRTDQDGFFTQPRRLAVNPT